MVKYWSLDGESGDRLRVVYTHTRNTDTGTCTKPKRNVTQRNATHRTVCLPDDALLCALFAQAMSGIFEIDERDITDVQQALALKEIAITLEGKGGFHMLGTGQDFDATLKSYIKAALKDQTAHGHTLQTILVNDFKQYEVTYPVVFVTEATAAAILGPHTWRQMEITYTVYTTKAEGKGTQPRTCTVNLTATENVPQLPGFRKPPLTRPSHRARPRRGLWPSAG